VFFVGNSSFFMVTFESVWSAEFAPQVAAARRVRSEQLTEAFLDVPLTVAGEELRQMTPADLLHLDALGNPFVAGSPDQTLHFLDVAGFLWQLHTTNDHTATLGNLWRRTRLLRRLAARDLRPAAEAISAYVDRMLLDPSSPAPAPADRAAEIFAPDPRSHFLAPLLVAVASDIGHLDPMSGQLLAHTPLPRLLQYRREIQEKTDPQKTYTETDSLRNRCMDRVNQLNAAARLQSVSPSPSSDSVSSVPLPPTSVTNSETLN
jgi:hypothetical protein